MTNTWNVVSVVEKIIDKIGDKEYKPYILLV